MNPNLLAVILDAAPNIISSIRVWFQEAHPNAPVPTDAEVEAAFHQVLTDSLSKDAAWLAAHPIGMPNPIIDNSGG